MWRLIKTLFILVLLAAVAFVAYAYAGPLFFPNDFAPPSTQITQPVTLDVVFNGGARDALRGAYVTGFSATTSFNRSDFGISKYVGPVSDEVEVLIEAEFIRQ